MPIDVEVCIIGAGAAGLKAAHTLLTKSDSLTQNDIVVVEAQDRIGGRLYTDRSSSKIGLHYDLGASWFHDCLSNVVFQHFYSGEGEGDKEIFDILSDGYFDDKPVKVFLSAEIAEIDMHKTNMETITHDIETFCELYFIDKLSTDEDITLKQLVELYIEKYSKILTEQEKKYAKVTMRYYELWHGVSWDRLSARYAVLDHNGRDLFNKKGYDFLINWLLQIGISKDRVLLNSPVSKIYRDASKFEGNRRHRKCAVEIRGSSELIYCDYLVVTVPQSILSLDYKVDPKYGIEWVPALPASMQSALKNIHFGALGKVIFEFDSIWWNKNQDRFSILADENVATDGIETLTSLPKPFSFPALAVNNSNIHKSDKGSLTILTQTPLTEYLESNPDQAWSYYGPMLARISTTPYSPPPAPINTITTKWTTNPYIRGSYVACYKGDDPTEIISQLSGEIDGMGLSSSTIRFAGEHTSFEGEGCVHGAWMSGVREAEWILKHSGKGGVTKKLEKWRL